MRRDSEENWFALWTRSRHEQVVREQLEQKAHRDVSADRHPVEPLERSQEEDRLAAVSRAIASRDSILASACLS